MRLRRVRLRTIHIAVLDRHMAESQAIGRAVAAGARWARVHSSERIIDPDSSRPVWEIVVIIPRKRR